MLNLAMGTVYKQFIDKDITNFDDFHMAILDIFNNFNAALPGKYYEVPPRKEVEAFFTKWKETEESKDSKEEPKKKQLLVEFMRERVRPSKLDESTLMTGLVTPPAAMAVKRAGESVPQLKIIKTVPDVVFVPAATVLALFSVKLFRRIVQGDATAP